MKNESDKKSNKKDDKSKKALFFQRLFAFFIDSAIVVFASSLLATPFINSDKINELNDKSIELMEKRKDNKISDNEYLAEYMNITYDVAKNEGVISLINIIASLVIFVVIPLYKNGQSIGKKLFRIKITSDNGDLSMNQLIFRSFIANSILVNLISVILMIFLSKNNYFYCYGLFVVIQYIINALSIFLIICRKDGKSIHDLLVKTQVVKI